MRKTIVALGLIVAALAQGCVVKQQYVQPKLGNDVDELMEDIDTLPPFPTPEPDSGSVWTGAGIGAALVRDTTAFRTNDMVTIDLIERVLGTNEAITELERNSEADVGASVAGGLESTDPQPGEFNINQVLKSNFATKFNGDGATTRSSLLSGSITARVMRVLSNGDLIVGGQKTVMINRERQVLTLVGSVRPVDIERNNRVISSKVGELTVRLWGQGEVDDTVRQGWFMRVLNRVWPF